MTEPRRRKASEMPPYRHTADRMADLEEKVAHLEALVMEMLTLDTRDMATLKQRIEALETAHERQKTGNQILMDRLYALEHPAK